MFLRSILDARATCAPQRDKVARLSRGPLLVAALYAAVGLSLLQSESARAEGASKDPYFRFIANCDTDLERSSSPPPAADSARPVAALRGGTPTRVTGGVKVPLVHAGTSTGPGRTIMKYCADHAEPGNSREHFHGTGAQAHTYRNPGRYTPQIYAIDDTGVWSATEARTTFYVNGLPTASFAYSPDPPVTNTPVTFMSTSKDHPKDVENGEAGLVKHEWNIDGRIASGPRISHTFTSAGQHSVALTVTDKHGESHRVAETVTIDNRRPLASFTYASQSPEAGSAVTFTSTSSDPDGTIKSWRWDLDGDGVHDDAAGPTASYRFPEPGSYSVSLQVTDNAASTTTVARSITVVPVAATTLAATVLGGAPIVVQAPAGGVGPRGVEPRRVKARVRLRATAGGRFTRLLVLSVAAERGATVRVLCRGRSCRFHRQTLRAVSSRALRFRRFERRLSVGAVLEVLVTKPGTVGRYAAFAVRRGQGPRRSQGCLAPGTRRQTRC